jgi:DNA polymerase-3 subunit gamma/tau
MAGESQSLYRKYRPRSFDEAELVGQEAVARTLRNAIQTGRVAHAYLFCGPRGTGKTSTARLLAKAVNCEHPEPARRPCNECRACRAIGLGENRSMDIIEIDAASNRGIDDIRELRERIAFAPSELTYKFYIIDEVHQLSEAAANALLKTLEEPPRHAKFVLATTDPQKMLETIVSRCQVFRFRRIPLDKMVARLRLVCAAEGLTADDDALALIARQATGSLRDALGLLDKLVAYSSERITAALVQQALGIHGDERAVELVDAALAGDLPAALGTINAVVDEGVEPRLFTQQVVEYLRELLLRLAGGSSPTAGLAPIREAAQARQAEQTSLPVVADLVQRLSAIDYALERGAYGALPLELALVEAVLAREQGDRGAGERGSDQRPAPLAPRGSREMPRRAPARAPAPAGREWAEDEDRSATPSPPPAPATAAPATPPAPEPVPVAADGPAPAAEIGIDQLQEIWQRVRRDMRATQKKIEALLLETEPLAIDGDRLVLMVTFPFHRERITEESRRTVIEAAIERHAGRRYRLQCVLPDEAAPYRARAAQPADAPPAGAATAATPLSGAGGSDAEPSAADDARRVQAAANLFNARPVS